MFRVSPDSWIWRLVLNVCNNIQDYTSQNGVCLMFTVNLSEKLTSLIFKKPVVAQRGKWTFFRTITKSCQWSISWARWTSSHSSFRKLRVNVILTAKPRFSRRSLPSRNSFIYPLSTCCVPPAFPPVYHPRIVMWRVQIVKACAM
jgi:hypothetical protein